MGIDVVIYIEGEVTDQELADAEKYMLARVEYAKDKDNSLLERSKYSEIPRVEVYTFYRYYGPGYERGSWPQIFGVIAAMQGAFPDRKVYYGGDTADIGEETTTEFLASIWAHWVGPHGNNYYESIKEFRKTFIK